MATERVYDISEDFSSGVNESQLHSEIVAETSITTALDGVRVDWNEAHNDGSVTVLMQADFQAGEESALDTVVAAHTPA